MSIQESKEPQDLEEMPGKHGFQRTGELILHPHHGLELLRQRKQAWGTRLRAATSPLLVLSAAAAAVHMIGARRLSVDGRRRDGMVPAAGRRLRQRAGLATGAV